MSKVVLPVEFELTPRSRELMASLSRILDPKFIAADPEVDPPVRNIPAIGQPWPGVAGLYAGVTRGRDGSPDEHLVYLDITRPDKLSWGAAMAWAKEVGNDVRVPTRFESALIYANLFEQIDSREAHWTSTQYSDLSAWYQGFNGGLQDNYGKSAELRVRLCRSFPL